MQAKDIMTSPVITVGPDVPVGQVAKLLLEKRISGVPVVAGDGRLLGVVSEGDLLRRVETGTERRKPSWLEMLIGQGSDVGDFIKSHGLHAGDVMTREVVSAAPDASLRDLAELMERNGIKRVPIVEGGGLVGIVSRANLLKGLVEDRAGAPVQSSDEQIRTGLADLLRREPWVDHRRINVVVADGVVQLWGSVENDEQRRALVIAAESHPGVRSVEDHLTANWFTNEAG
ncbi:CBS domain-containing protein (plasmid) [Skermanella rosea]|uniref:CBS domain-containing protein n=1 Tax=Skermanella rosea TaxID=1817965 RepID=UPI001932D6EE|nr:CBS domain-containing protein [Skermanella rosea]UEM07001.1 CBS domain-containing protein [Skermanella rosea]